MQVIKKQPSPPRYLYTVDIGQVCKQSRNLPVALLADSGH